MERTEGADGNRQRAQGDWHTDGGGMPSAETISFISANADGDARRLALQAARHPGVDMPFALDQIAGRQMARRKLPSWAATDGVVYPPHLALEQCSGERAATYKAGVARRLCGGGRLVDLTGGFGVDFAFMARCFNSAVYVERQERLCALTRHNLPLLGIGNASVVCADGVEYLRSMPPTTMIYVDPARRDANGGRTAAIADCTPDVLSLRDELLRKATVTMVKLAPMLDWRKAAADMGDRVRETHIVSVGGECKELLLVLANGGDGSMSVHCVNDGSDFAFDAEDGNTATAPQALPPPRTWRGYHLYEPNASVMKAGCYGLVERRYGVRAVARDSHLFLSPVAVTGFPGRAFVINAVTTMNKKELKATMNGISKANLSVRNFPITVAALRHRLKIGDGSDTYIFATTTADGNHVLLVCSKA